jgi:hypothetical protein
MCNHLRITALRFLLPILAFPLALPVGPTFAGDKQVVPKDFDNKLFVVTSTGLAVGTCDIPCSADDLCVSKYLPTLAVRANGSSLEFHPQSGFGVCHGTLLATPIDIGTVLESSTSVIDKHESRYCLLLRTEFPISVTRGIGAFAHPSAENGGMSLRIHLDDPTNVQLIGAALNQWLTQVDSLANALTLSAKLTHKEAEKSVKQISLGMTFYDVENAMGVPDTRVDLGTKVLFKYPTMTVTFQDGKVADVQ